LGFIYGGIIANAPHVRHNPGALSSASNHVFEVVLIPVPEPGALALVACGGIIGVFLRRQRLPWFQTRENVAIPMYVCGGRGPGRVFGTVFST